MPGPVSPLSFEQPVPRGLVHRRSTNEVLPTDFLLVDEALFDVALQWPRRHPMFSVAPLNSALVAESVRQVTILACHLGFRVPDTTRFLMTGLGFEVNSYSSAMPAGRAVEVVCRVQAVNIRTTAHSLRSVRMNMVFTREGEPVASGHGDALLVSGDVYGRLRGGNVDAVAPVRRSPGALAPAEAGVDEPLDVVLARSASEWVVDVPGDHPVFFDHPLDHVPGVALIEACRQLACVQFGDPNLDLGSFDGRFRKMVEFASPAFVQLELTRQGAEFAIVQDGAVAAAATATITEPSGDGPVA